jgi:hypothetical protein
MGYVSNKGVLERGGTVGKKGLKLKGTTAIIMKRGMKWNKLQIRVMLTPSFFFNSCGVVLSLEYFYSGEIIEFSIIKNVGRECFCSEKM